IHVETRRVAADVTSRIRLNAQYRIRAIRAKEERLLVSEEIYIAEQIHFTGPLAVSFILEIQVDIGRGRSVGGNRAEVADPHEFLVVVRRIMLAGDTQVPVVSELML